MEVTMLGNTEDEGDLGIIGQDSELLVTLQESDLTWLKSVSEAVERIDNGNYGECVSCCQDIDEETLAALPWVAFCLRCARYQVGTRPPCAIQDGIEG
jgi:DnaK suppressor protein